MCPLGARTRFVRYNFIVCLELTIPSNYKPYHTRIFQIIEISLLQVILFTVGVCVRARARGRTRTRLWKSGILVRSFVMGDVLQFGEIAQHIKRLLLSLIMPQHDTQSPTHKNNVVANAFQMSQSSFWGAPRRVNGAGGGEQHCIS